MILAPGDPGTLKIGAFDPKLQIWVGIPENIHMEGEGGWMQPKKGVTFFRADTRKGLKIYLKILSR